VEEVGFRLKVATGLMMHIHERRDFSLFNKVEVAVNDSNPFDQSYCRISRPADRGTACPVRQIAFGVFTKGKAFLALLEGQIGE
jgi:hypothetical protein